MNYFISYFLNYYPYILVFLVYIFIYFVLRRYGKFNHEINSFRQLVIYYFYTRDILVLSVIGFVATIFDHTYPNVGFMYMYFILAILYIVFINLYRYKLYKNQNIEK